MPEISRENEYRCTTQKAGLEHAQFPGAGRILVLLARMGPEPRPPALPSLVGKQVDGDLSSLG